MATGQPEVVPLDLTKPLPKMSYKDGALWVCHMQLPSLA